MGEVLGELNQLIEFNGRVAVEITIVPTRNFVQSSSNSVSWAKSKLCLFIFFNYATCRSLGAFVGAQ